MYGCSLCKKANVEFHSVNPLCKEKALAMSEDWRINVYYKFYVKIKCLNYVSVYLFYFF